MNYKRFMYSQHQANSCPSVILFRKQKNFVNTQKNTWKFFFSSLKGPSDMWVIRGMSHRGLVLKNLPQIRSSAYVKCYKRLLKTDGRISSIGRSKTAFNNPMTSKVFQDMSESDRLTTGPFTEIHFWKKFRKRKLAKNYVFHIKYTKNCNFSEGPDSHVPGPAQLIWLDTLTDILLTSFTLIN